jgi:alpha-glucosidase (family GH31 glycosyl hydrolase)
MIKLYFNFLISPLENDGVDFFWIDTNDVKQKDILWSLDNYHYMFGSLDYRKRPFIMTRNSNIAEHRYPVTYSGKTVVGWNTLKMIPKYNMLATDIGNSFWAHDIGGYHEGMEDNELYIRFVELGTFSPILKFGSSGGRFYKREPWKWSYKTFKIAKDYLKLRHSLIPYLYSEAYKYHKTARPLIIPLYYEQPEAYDDPIYNTEYFFGSEFFVSPILKSKDFVMNRVIHRFYLPAGIWFDYVTGKKEQAGKLRHRFSSVTIKTYLDELDEICESDSEKIEAVRLSINYNFTSKVMKPFTNGSGSGKSRIEQITGKQAGATYYENEDQSVMEGVTF